MAVLVTTDKRGSYQHQAERLVGELAAAGQPARLVERHAGSTLLKLLDANPDAEALMVVDERATLRMRDGAETRLHGGIGVLRLRHLAKGGSDAMVEACGLQAGETFVDCTAGECHDAIVAAWVVGMDGCVIGMEASPLIYAVASVRPLRSGDSQMDNLVDRISMRLGDHTKLLAAMPSASADVVYFAPMYEHSRKSTAGFDGVLRGLAHYAPLSTEALHEARRVARRCVLVRDQLIGNPGTEPAANASNSGILERLAAPHICVGRTKRFGVWPAAAQ